MSDELEDLKRRLVLGHKRGGRSVYDEAAKSELVALCLRPDVSVARVARNCGVNANQVSRWLREHQQGGRRPAAGTRVLTPAASAAFMAVPVVRSTSTPADVADGGPATLQMQARLPNGVALDPRGLQTRHVGALIEALGSLRCSASTTR